MIEFKIQPIDVEIANCRKCLIGKKRKKNAIFRGSLNPVVLFVGEGPGKYEDLNGVPFCGPSGKLLDKKIKEFGLPEYAIINVVKCRPTDDCGQNRPPNDEEIKNCLVYLKEQIDLLAPKIIVAVGKVAFRVLSENAYDSIYLIHPSACLRKPELVEIMDKHMKKIKEKVGNI